MRRRGVFRACRESFVPGGAAGAACWESFVPVSPAGGACRESFVPASPAGGACRESFVPAQVPRAVQSSPCVACYWREREKILPACGKWAKIGVLGRAGRVLYRYRPPGACVGRVLYRHRPRVRYKVLPARLGGGGSGIKLSLLAQNGPKSAFSGVSGEFCTGIARRGRVLDEFCRGWVADRGVLGELFRGPAAVGSCRANLWCLDEGCVPPLDVGHAHTPRSRVGVALDVVLVPALRSRVRLPLGARVGTSLRPHATAFPQDSGHFPENFTNPYM